MMEVQRTPINTHRRPIKIRRRAIREASKAGRMLGGWFPFPIPDERPPYVPGLTSTQEVLWCPWCGSWEVFDSRAVSTNSMSEVVDSTTYKCTGTCGWSHTNEFYVRKYNHIWLGVRHRQR